MLGQLKWCETFKKLFRKNIRCNRLYVCVYVYWNYGKFELKYFRNYSTYRAEILCVLRVDAALSSILFSLKLNDELGFYDDLNFSKNVCNRSRCRKFRGIKQNAFS